MIGTEAEYNLGPHFAKPNLMIGTKVEYNLTS